MALDKFIPLSPDPDLNAGSDMTLAKFGHLNTIVDYLNAYVAVDSLQLAGSGPITATARYISDSTGVNSAISISTIGVGIGTNTLLGILHLKSTAATTRMVMDGDAGQSKIITYRTAGLQRFGLYTNNTAESGSNVGSDFAIRAYSDAGTLLNTPVFIKRSTGNVGIGTSSPAYPLDVLSSSASYIAQFSNTNGKLAVTYNGDGGVIIPLTAGKGVFLYNNAGSCFGISNTGGVGINTTTPTARLQVVGIGSTSATTSLLVQNSAGNDALKITDDRVTLISNQLLVNDQFGTRILNTLNSNGGIAIGNLTLGSGGGRCVDIIQNTTNSYGGIKFYNDVAQTSRIGGFFTDGTARFILQTTANDVTIQAGLIATSSSLYVGYLTYNTLPSSASVAIQSTTQGFLKPRLTTAQKNAIVTPAAGLEVYDTDLNRPCFYSGSAWVTL